MYLRYTTEDNKTCIAVISREAGYAIILRFDDLESLRIVMRALKDQRISKIIAIDGPWFELGKEGLSSLGFVITDKVVMEMKL